MAQIAAQAIGRSGREPLDASRSNVARRRRWDLVFGAVGLVSTMIGVLTLLALFIDLLIDGYPRLGWDFITSFPSRRAEQAGILSAWVGTCLVMLVTATIGVPLAVAAGLYLEEYARRSWVTTLIEINVSNLAAVPSIVYGLLALGLFVYGLGLGQSVLTAGLTLALMILPVIVVATREAVRAVPNSMREAAYACGATKWRVTRDHVLPYSIPGIMTGVIIGLARAIGETAPLITIGALTFIAFLPDSPIQSEFPFVSFEWLWSGFTVLPIQMFNWVSRPGTNFHANAAAAGVVIVALTLVMNGFAIWLRYRLRKRITW
ncbi:MAG TPA: phosphate ABC transporter permease PstA [Geminicoccaceae bacterium]|nr:phosphate ABC transporter permease PstA [Geminicoccaceae bacterium]